MFARLSRKIRKFKSGITIQFIAGFSFGSCIIILTFITFLWIYSRNQNKSISEGLNHLLSFDIDAREKDMEFDEDYFIKIEGVQEDIFGDFVVNYTLSDKLYDKCSEGFCKIVPFVETFNSEFEIAGPSKIIYGEFGKEGEVEVLKSIMEEGKDNSTEVQNSTKLIVRVFNEKGNLLGQIEGEMG